MARSVSAGRRVREHRLSVRMAGSGPRTKTGLSRLCSRRKLLHRWAAIQAKSIANSRENSVSLLMTALRHRPLLSKKKLWKNSQLNRCDYRSGGRKDPEYPHPRAGQWRLHRRAESNRTKRMVRRATIRYGRHLQDLCGELSRIGSFKQHPGGSADNR